MGVFRGSGADVDPLAISQEMRGAVRLWETCQIVIIDPGVNNVNLSTKSPSAFAWNGLARVQPYRREIGVATPTNPTTTQTVRFQVDFSADGVIPFVKHGFQILVLTEAQGNAEQPDPHLTEYVHVINASMNSSLAWIRTYETTVNTEYRNTFAIQSDGAGGIEWTP